MCTGGSWFYFMNEHVLRYLNLRVPRDYDTVPLYLFWGLVLVWLMPWSGYLCGSALRRRSPVWLARCGDVRLDALESDAAAAGGVGARWCCCSSAFSTRQEYYVPAGAAGADAADRGLV